MINKKAKLNQTILNTALLGIVLLVVLFQIYANIIPDAQSAGDTMGDSARCSAAGGFYNISQNLCLNGTTPADTAVVSYSAIPLSGLFSGTGVVFIIIMAALVVLIVKSYVSKK